MALDQLGAPLAGTYSIVGGQARLFERGATISGPAGQVVLTFDLPLIGTPGSGHQEGAAVTSGLVAMPQLFARLGVAGGLLIIAGGLVYSAGAAV